MSRMTKFLKQICSVERYKEKDTNDAETNRFGEYIYEEPIQCKCRNEVCFKDIKTENGSVVRSTSRYFLDESVEIKPDYRIDGKVAITVETYINQFGTVEGYEVYV